MHRPGLLYVGHHFEELIVDNKQCRTRDLKGIITGWAWTYANI
jgi:hypothetical protein